MSAWADRDVLHLKRVRTDQIGASIASFLAAFMAADTVGADLSRGEAFQQVWAHQVNVSI